MFLRVKEENLDFVSLLLKVICLSVAHSNPCDPFKLLPPSQLILPSCLKHLQFLNSLVQFQPPVPFCLLSPLPPMPSSFPSFRPFICNNRIHFAGLS